MRGYVYFGYLEVKAKKDNQTPVQPLYDIAYELGRCSISGHPILHVELPKKDDCHWIEEIKLLRVFGLTLFIEGKLDLAKVPIVWNVNFAVRLNLGGRFIPFEGERRELQGE